MTRNRIYSKANCDQILLRHPCGVLILLRHPCGVLILLRHPCGVLILLRHPCGVLMLKSDLIFPGSCALHPIAACVEVLGSSEDLCCF